MASASTALPRMGVSSAYSVLYALSSKQRVFSTDIGFDADDFLALLHLLVSGKLIGGITTLWRPDEKAAIFKRVVELFKESNMADDSTALKATEVIKNVFPGIGVYGESPKERYEDMKRLYPYWPSLFGNADVDPTDDPEYKQIYSQQLTAFEGVEAVAASTRTLDDFKIFLEGLEQPVTLVSTGPLSNEAALIGWFPELAKEKIAGIVMMNGTFSKPYRMGYNGGLNIIATRTVLESGIPCFIVPSHLCAKFELPLEMLKEIQSRRKDLSPLGTRMLHVIENWELHRARKKDPEKSLEEITIAPPIFADFLTAYIAENPGVIANMQPVAYEFNEGAIPEGYHLLHKKAPDIISVGPVDESSVFEIIELSDTEAIQKDLEAFIKQIFSVL